jgi:hypothetical protein
MKEKETGHFGGKHCWTTALRGVLDYHKLHLSEEMIFGLGGGLGFIYWYMKLMPSPFIGTRWGKPESLTNTFKRMGGNATIFETGSAAKGYEELKQLLRNSEPVFVFVDMAYLPYLALPGVAHFGGHTVVVYGLDEFSGIVNISDCAYEPLTVTIEELERARNSKFPPFPPKNKLLKIEYPLKVGSLASGIKEAIKECYTGMVNPPIKNIGLAGIKKWADIVPQWPKQFQGINLYGCLLYTFITEVGGTGGGAFRHMYAQFLRESSSILNEPKLNEVAALFDISGKAWTETANAALPDSWPLLKKARELSIEKNILFREQNQGALEAMQKINLEAEQAMDEASEELQKKDITPLLANLRQKILAVYQTEEKAFQALSAFV